MTSVAISMGFSSKWACFTAPMMEGMAKGTASRNPAAAPAAIAFPRSLKLSIELTMSIWLAPMGEIFTTNPVFKPAMVLKMSPLVKNNVILPPVSEERCCADDHSQQSDDVYDEGKDEVALFALGGMCIENKNPL